MRSLDPDEAGAEAPAVRLNRGRWYPNLAKTAPNARYTGRLMSRPMAEPSAVVDRRIRPNTTAITAAYTAHSFINRRQGTGLDASHAMARS